MNREQIVISDVNYFLKKYNLENLQPYEYRKFIDRLLDERKVNKNKLHRKTEQVSHRNMQIKDLKDKLQLALEGYNVLEIEDIQKIYKKTGYTLVFIPQSKLNR